MAQLDLFSNTSFEGVTDIPKPKPIIALKKEEKPSDKLKMVKALTKTIEVAQKKADNISTEVSGNYTAKRGREANQRRHEKERLEKNIQALTRIKEEWLNDTVPEVLSKIKSLNDLLAFDWGIPKPLDGTEYDHYIESYEKQMKTMTRLGISTKEQSDKGLKLIEEYRTVKLSEEQIKARELRDELEKLRLSNIPGFFPTPDDLIDRMLDEAMMFESKGMNILEPSAGIGSICDKVRDLDYDHKIVCCETQYILIKILELKGYTLASNDIFDMVPMAQFHRIIMNPPFENKQDVKHVSYCFDKFLRPGGILVSIMSAGVKNNTDTLTSEFRELVSKYGYFIDLEGGEFKGAFRSTGVRTCIVFLKK